MSLSGARIWYRHRIRCGYSSSFAAAAASSLILEESRRKGRNLAARLEIILFIFHGGFRGLSDSADREEKNNEGERKMELQRGESGSEKANGRERVRYFDS